MEIGQKKKNRNGKTGIECKQRNKNRGRHRRESREIIYLSGLSASGLSM